MNWKFWERSQKEIIKTSRMVTDIEIGTVEGLAGSRQIVVKGWNAVEAFDLFKKVRKELKK